MLLNGPRMREPKVPFFHLGADVSAAPSEFTHVYVTEATPGKTFDSGALAVEQPGRVAARWGAHPKFAVTFLAISLNHEVPRRRVLEEHLPPYVIHPRVVKVANIRVKGWGLAHGGVLDYWGAEVVGASVARIDRRLVVANFKPGLLIRIRRDLLVSLFLEGLVSDWINAHPNELLLDVGVPVVLDLVVRSSGQPSCYLGPPEADENS